MSEAPYILDGVRMNETGRSIREQYADTGGFTNHVLAVTALLGFQFIPRLRDLPSKRLYVFDPAYVAKELKGLVGRKVRQNIISANWPDILRSAATMVAGVMPPSQLLRKFAVYPRQHELAEALKKKSDGRSDPIFSQMKAMMDEYRRQKRMYAWGARSRHASACNND